MKIRLLIIALLCSGASLFGQNLQKGLNYGDTTQIHTLVTRDYQSLKGTLLSVENDVLVFQLNSGQVLNFLRDEVSRVYYTDKNKKPNSKGREPRLRGLQSTIIAPSSIPRPKGDHTYRNFLVFYNEFSFSLHDNLDLDVSLMPVVFLNNGGLRLRYARSLGENLHYNLHSDTRVFLGTAVDFSAYQFLGGGLTFGQQAVHMNINATYAFGLSPALDNALVFSIGARARTGYRWTFFLEVINAPFEDSFTDFLFIGTGYFGSRGRFDFGLMNASPSLEDGIILPFFGFTWFI